MTTGDRLRAARALTGISTKELDRLAGITLGHTWIIEQGKSSTTAATLDKVAQVLGLSLDYLVRGAGKKPNARSVNAALESWRKRHGSAA